MSISIKNQWQTVLEFWFGTYEGSSSLEKARVEWFRKDSSFDARVRDMFLSLHGQAMAGILDAWVEQSKSALALIIVLDQFSRNIFRDTPRAFAGDDKALKAAKEVIRRGFDQLLSPLQRAFVYLPFEHSESLDDQETSLCLFGELSNAFPETVSFYEYALKHHQVIARFGRFPHRNQFLGRPSSEEELMYLSQPGSRF